MNGNTGSFLPDIYMTTTANGKVTMISGSKQVASQGDVAKRLIKKTKQFILLEETASTSSTTQLNVKKREESEAYFNMKES